MKNSEKVAYISFDESKKEVYNQAKSFGWDLNSENFVFVDWVSELNLLESDFLYLDFDSLNEVRSFISKFTTMDELKGITRLFIDGVGALRDASNNPTIFRRMISSITDILHKNEITTIVSMEMSEKFGKDPISYLTSGEFELDRIVRSDGEVIRTFDVMKYRPGKAILGRHYFEITEEGIVVFPITPKNKIKKLKHHVFSTGNKQLDSLIGGNINAGSVIMITGKTGVGKTNLSLQFLVENDRMGRKGILYTFEESENEIKRRFKDLFAHEVINVVVKELSPYGMNIGKFYNVILEDVETLKPDLVVIDPINSLENVVLSTDELTRVINYIREHLKNYGITLILTHELLNPVDVFQFSGGLSFIADILIYGRHMELDGELIKSISVIKNRFGDHERSVRILDLEEGKGLQIGEPLKNFKGVMRGYLKEL